MLMMIFLLLILMKLKCKAAKKQLWEVKTKVHTFFNALIISNEHFIVEHWIEWWGRKEKQQKNAKINLLTILFLNWFFFLILRSSWNGITKYATAKTTNSCTSHRFRKEIYRALCSLSRHGIKHENWIGVHKIIIIMQQQRKSRDKKPPQRWSSQFSAKEHNFSIIIAIHIRLRAWLLHTPTSTAHLINNWLLHFSNRATTAAAAT